MAIDDIILKVMRLNNDTNDNDIDDGKMLIKSLIKDFQKQV